MHEQSRSDRDEYIRMIEENLKENINDGNMAKFSTFDYNAYDYESIMQYGLWVIIICVQFWSRKWVKCEKLIVEFVNSSNN